MLQTNMTFNQPKKRGFIYLFQLNEEDVADEQDF